jgi:hypothetical protein
MGRAVNGSGISRYEGVGRARRMVAMGRITLLSVDRIERSGILGDPVSFVGGLDPTLEGSGAGDQHANLEEGFSV